jgi:hypothetical protein
MGNATSGLFLRWSWLAGAIAWLVIFPIESSQAKTRKAHAHGLATMTVALDAPSTLTVSIEIPLDSLVGFERAPRTDAERSRARDALAVLRNPSTVVKPSQAARCTPTSMSVQAPALEAAALSTTPQSKEDHADARVTHVFNCAEPLALQQLELVLMQHFGGIHDVRVDVALPGVQRRVSLRKPHSVLRLDAFATAPKGR